MSVAKCVSSAGGGTLSLSFAISAAKWADGSCGSLYISRNSRPIFSRVYDHALTATSEFSDILEHLSGTPLTFAKSHYEGNVPASMACQR